MAKRASIPADLQQVSRAVEPGDEALTADELGCLSVFADVRQKNRPSFEQFPGTTFLRHGLPGRVICEQGEAGATAFYLLTPKDVVALREKQIDSLAEVTSVESDKRQPSQSHVQGIADDKLGIVKLELEAERNRWAAKVEAEPSPVLKVFVLTPQQQQEAAAKGFWQRAFARFSRPKSQSRAAESPAFIPIDAPVGRDAALYEGDLFGEMSCLNRTPRAARVVVDQECYVLEMLRNVLDQIRRDPEQKQRIDERYRERVLRTHLQSLSFFSGLNLGADVLRRLQEEVELVDFQPGDVLFEQHDASDAIYVIRSGLVKVIKDVGCQLRSDEFTAAHAAALLKEFGQEPSDTSWQHRIWKSLKTNLSERLSLASAGALSDEQVDSLRSSLNEFIRDAGEDFQKQFGPTTQAVLGALPSSPFAPALRGFPDEMKHWSQLEWRIFRRLLLEAAYPAGMPRRAATTAPMQTLAYHGTGMVIGEMGVFQGKPRSATCIAYDHPDGRHGMRVPDSRTGAVPSHLELVKISRHTFERLIVDSPALKQRVEEIIDRRRARSELRRQPKTTALAALRQSSEFDDLGLVQGQKLMLIDLDRCTRCGECVAACIHAHDDGKTRLYLDGPRFGDYLVPLTCRKCLDPVCMIGCPVGSINRGEDGEIVIRDWCIGCSMCADQCPYGAIQMSPLDEARQLTTLEQSMLAPETGIVDVTKQAVVCDLCSGIPTGPACVYACPHDAARREDASVFFFMD